MNCRIMKKLVFILLTITGMGVGMQPARGQETGVFEFRVDHEKAIRSVVITLDADAAPETVANFEKLLRHKFYKGLKVHRVIPHTLVQMGDPLSRYTDRARVGTGGPGYTLPPEVHLKHTTGAVAMSRLPDTLNPARRSSGSQFYICLKPMPQLDGQYTVFGHVTAGMDVLDDLSTAAADTNNNPTTAIVITQAYLGSRPPHEFSFKIWPW
jgi:cyclophilin family peptidyl-prolyl cis-trans isomerase